jgi:hypothetical protein
MSVSTRALAQDESFDDAGLRAEGHANADFARAAADRVAHDAIEAHRGEHQADESERAEERRGEMGQKVGGARTCSSMVCSL